MADSTDAFAPRLAPPFLTISSASIPCMVRHAVAPDRTHWRPLDVDHPRRLPLKQKIDAHTHPPFPWLRVIASFNGS